MKNVMYFIVVLLFGLFIGCQNKPLINNQLEALYQSMPDDTTVFSSNNYSITDYEGTNEIALPSGKGLIFISNVSGKNETFFAPGGMLTGLGVEISSLGKTVRVCYKNKPFFQASSVPLPCNSFSPIKFSLREYTIDDNSFIFVHGDHDFQGEVGGLYVNGNLVSQNVMVKGGVPFMPCSVKKVDGKIIINFESASRASLYALFNENTGQLTLPIDYETIENDYTVQKR